MKESHILTTLVLLFCFSGYALALSPDDEHAQETALQWLQLVDSGNYSDAAQMMAEEVRGQQDWVNYFTTRRASLGRARDRKVVDLKHASTVPGDAELRLHAIIRFKSAFARKSLAIEEVVLMKRGCCWEVCGYRINDQ
jgi:hypothetical protein